MVDRMVPGPPQPVTLVLSLFSLPATSQPPQFLVARLFWGFSCGLSMAIVVPGSLRQDSWVSPPSLGSNHLGPNYGWLLITQPWARSPPELQVWGVGLTVGSVPGSR